MDIKICLNLLNVKIVNTEHENKCKKEKKIFINILYSMIIPGG